VLQEIQVHQELLVLKVVKVYKVLLDPQDQVDQQVPLVLKVQLDLMVLQVLKVSKVLQDQVVQQVP
jgi:hypothetical protein